MQHLNRLCIEHLTMSKFKNSQCVCVLVHLLILCAIYVFGWHSWADLLVCLFHWNGRIGLRDRCVKINILKMLFSDTIFLFFYFGFVKDSNVKQKNQQKQKSQWHKRISQIEIHCFAKQVIYATAQFMFISYSNYFTSICIFFSV